MSLPKISIVTPSFNQAHFIEQNIQSVLQQQYPNVEHLIIDGGSTDGTVDILKRYPHLIWVSEPDRGQTNALNKGFKLATGEIVGWLNSDDTYCEGAFHHVIEAFRNPDVNALCGNGFEVDEEGKVLRRLFGRGIEKENLIRYWKWNYEYVQPAFFFRKTALEEIGYLDEQLYYVMDYELFLRMSLRYPFHSIEEPLANFRLYGQSKTGKKIKKIIPDWIWELHRVSKRHWGSPMQLKYYSYLFSFIGAIFFSVVKNIFFVRGSKSRNLFTRTIGR